MEEVLQVFKEGNFIKERIPNGKQWKVMRFNGIWYELLNANQRRMLFRRQAKHWKVVAEDDTMQPPKKRTYKLRKHV